jgi:hypothetical protein
LFLGISGKCFESQLTPAIWRKFQPLILDLDPLERRRILIRGRIVNRCEKNVTPAATILQGSLKTDTLRFIFSKKNSNRFVVPPSGGIG